ncbi:O-antigen ligase family protein [Thermoflexus sp.]|uniref:O-antigen ligase family protein n=2 Tax=Thermoflexus sp. TaxID=1969742 RepID=UPI0025EB55A1|nr:O-antigen ligase family protein [Thermoflexus sp.]MDW8179810.1 O-antigen ligase family protein [Anaerolineae bacterium]MCS6962452.1 O-antigen ligase family protein [Thermoflexus sp.]MCS7350359.1 O-antigen ligase family protein [Thermoflexus sp.]MCX7689796.1 O-antigen ligase family protein [Thermoflexus sp.]MDW8184271.1 O-antigen ligase family protein [Anaerolineae bacterium]
MSGIAWPRGLEKGPRGRVRIPPALWGVGLGLLLSPWIGMLVLTARGRWIALGLLGALAFPALLFFSRYAVEIILFASLFIPFTISTGSQSPIVASLLLTGLFGGLWLLRLVFERERWPKAPAVIPLLGFMVVSVISFFWSEIWRDPMIPPWFLYRARLGGLGVMLLSPLALWLAAAHLRHPRQVDRLVGMFLIAGAMGAIQILAGRTLFPFLNTGGLFPMWLFSFGVAFLVFRPMPAGLRVGLLLMLGIWGWHVMVPGISWISGWLPPIAALLVVVWLRSRWLFALVASILALMAVVYWRPLQFWVFDYNYWTSGTTRLEAWARNWQVTREHLLFGTGPAGYAAYYMTYFPDQAMATHSNYIDVLAQTGLIGMGFFIWFLAALGREIFQIWRWVRSTDHQARALVAGLIGGFAGLLVAMGLGDWFLPFPYTQTIAGYRYTVWGWIFAGAAVAMGRYYRNLRLQLSHAAWIQRGRLSR